jgi:HD-GYP domain-containing protein (c-di-GMP phosphodiesterase class II)
MGVDQSGYPKIQGRPPQYMLHFTSLLVAVVDIYDALRTVRPYRPALTVAKASTILIRDAMSGKLHKEYVSSFLFLVNVLSVGRRVVLSDRSRGVIVETHTSHPLCPWVGDEHGRVRDLSDPSAPLIWEVMEDAMDDLQ